MKLIPESDWVMRDLTESRRNMSPTRANRPMVERKVRSDIGWNQVRLLTI